MQGQVRKAHARKWVTHRQYESEDLHQSDEPDENEAEQGEV